MIGVTLAEAGLGLVVGNSRGVDYAVAELSPMARSFYDDNKRVRNDRIKDELGFSLAFPDYRMGLKSLFDAGF